MSNFDDKNIDFWINNNLNVLLRGKAGVGKTARILEAFKRHNLKYQYYSASTMDVWTDMIGIPKERLDSNGQPFLDLVRPKVWQDDNVEVLFLDEFNRAPKKIRNAVMELIQFKSINGKKFNNLRMVWAAINPEDEEVNKYDVEPLDPAQMDRFHVILNVPYHPEASFFREKYGRDQADIALTWWKETLNDKEREMVSPRRLDYVLDIFNKGGDVRPLVHHSISTLPLTQQLKNGPISKQLEVLYDKKDTMGAKRFLGMENNYTNSVNHIIKKRELMEFFLPQMSNEKVTVLMNQHKQVSTFVFANYPSFRELIHQIAASKSGQLSSQASAVIMQNITIADLTATGDWKPKQTSTEATFAAKLATVKGVDLATTQNRIQTYKTLSEALPQDLSLPVATETLKTLETCVCRSNQETTVREMPDLPKMVSHVIDIFERAGAKWQGIVDHKTLVNKLNDIDTRVKQTKDISKARETLVTP